MSVKQTLVEVAKDSPIPVLTGVVLFGYSLDTWVLVFTLIWAVIRVVQVALETWWKFKDRQYTLAKDRDLAERLEKATNDKRQASE